MTKFTPDSTVTGQREYEQVPCSLCGRTDARLLLTRRQCGGKVYVSICPQDGLVFLNPRWTPQRYMQFYATEYDRHFRTDEFEQVPTDSAKYDRARRVEEHIRHDVPGPLRAILDIGCGKGYLLEYISRKYPGSHLAGIEPSSDCISYATQKLGIEMLSRDAHSDWDAAAEAQYDLVIMRHVLEHLSDPLVVLRKVRRVLSPQGTVYIAVPNMMHPNESLDRWFRLVHTYFFSKHTLLQAARLAGLQPVTINAESPELWALFRAGTPDRFEPQSSIFKTQLAVIQRFRRRELPRDIITIPARLLVPKRIRKFIPESLKTIFR